MKHTRSIHPKILALCAVVSLAACTGNPHDFDASGAFEAREVIVSAEATGVLESFELEEGKELSKHQRIGYIDSTQLHLKKQQLIAQMEAVESRKVDIDLQLAALHEQLCNAQMEQKRINRLVEKNAATTKQLDDLNSNIAVLKKQLQAQKSSLNTTNNGIDKDVEQLSIQAQQIEDQLKKSRITSPIEGTVLTKYVEEGEMAMTGKALFKMANLSEMILRTYVSGNQLPQLKINQKVRVYTDNGEGSFKGAEGTITWISNKAEFTPKTIQTKDERANMVYALKIKVPNDGTYKIGMYGEIKFQE